MILRRSVVVGTAVLLTLLMCCAARVEPPAPAPAGSLDVEARRVVETRCGLCHREDSPQAKRRALAVFNLNRADWLASMSDDQLKSARARLADAPTGGDPASPDELATFDAFVLAELQSRAERAGH
jgi:hypothetical protein